MGVGVLFDLVILVVTPAVSIWYPSSMICTFNIPHFTRAIWKVRSMVFFLSNRLTIPFMFGITLKSYLSSVSGHHCHDNIVMKTRIILL